MDPEYLLTVSVGLLVESVFEDSRQGVYVRNEKVVETAVERHVVK